MLTPEPPPKFFLDRSLGRVAVPALLRAAGWSLVTLAEHYGVPEDERVADPEWIQEAAIRGWPILMKDKRIRYRSAEIGTVIQYQAQCFVITSAVGSGPVRPCRRRRPLGANASRAPGGAPHGQRGVPDHQRIRVRWWSHSGLVTGYASLLAATGSFSVAIMSNDSHGENLITEVFAHVAATYGPGPVQLTNLFAESIARWIQMTADQDSAVGRYVLPWGAEVHVTAPMGQHAPELHLTLPGQQPVKLLPVAPRQWQIPGLAGTDIAFDAPGRMRISQHGHPLDARRAD